MKPIRAGVLGATGAVGQRFVQLLDANPWFEITALAASERSVGRPYHEACTWRLSADSPASVRDIVVKPCAPGLDCDLVFSALPSSVAGPVEIEMAAAGYGVLSNASAHRMDPDVPLLIPEVNPEHLALLDTQRANRGWDKGFIVTDPNCSTVGMTLALKPLHDAFGISRVIVTTMQALSGAGYPGVPSLDIIDNVVPFIRNEEDKLIDEPRKLLGALRPGSDGIEMAEVTISPSCNRVATRDGHMEVMSIEFRHKPTREAIVEALASFPSKPYQMGCPSAVDPTIIVRSEDDRPQPVLDRNVGNGMAITVGRIRPCEVFDYKLVTLSHNTLRGAASGSVLNAEIMAAQGMLS